MTGRETLRFVTSLYPPERRSADKGITDILARVGLADAADRKAGTYSGGMRQRLGIAQALVGRPTVLLLDEPVSSLDPIGRREVLELMRDLKGETTVFYSTHILDDVERVSDHVAILDAGKLVRAEPTAQLLASFTKNRLSVILSGADDTTLDALKALPGVVSVDPGKRGGDLHAYVLTVEPDAGSKVQRAITRFAADHGLTVTENHVVTLGLEDVFLRLVNTKEHVA
jgi:ABC-2 type transport system ATP-binding protein